MCQEVCSTNECGKSRWEHQSNKIVLEQVDQILYSTLECILLVVVFLSLTMTKSDDGIQGVENQRRINHAIVVKLAKILDYGNTTLIMLEDVLL